MSTRCGRGAAIVAAALALAPSGAFGVIPEPPHVVRGTVTVAGAPRTWGTVSARYAGAAADLAACAIGSVPGEPSGYLLQLPMDALDPQAPGTAREGEAVDLLLDGSLVAATTVGGRGLVQTLDLDVPAPPHALVFLRPPSALPSSVESGGAVFCDAAAADTLGHAVAYFWAAACPGDPGSFDDPASPAPVWTAPAAAGRDPWACDLTVTVDDGLGLVEARTVRVTVAPAPTSDPVAVATAVPNPASCGQTILFDGTGSWHGDPARAIVSWEWDFDYDGATFDSNASGPTVTHSYGAAAGPFTVALRVTDDGAPPKSAVATLPVDPAGLNRSPVAAAGGPYGVTGGQSLQLDGSGSSDPDAACGDAIAVYAWDLDGDGTFGEAVGAQPLLSWGEVAQLVCGGACEHGVAYPIALRVTDARGGWDVDATSVTAALLIFADDFSDGTPAGDPDWAELRGAWTVRGVADKYYRSASVTKASIAVPLAYPDPGPAAIQLEFRLALLPKYAKFANGSVLFAWQDATHYRYVRLLRKKSFKLVLGQVGALGGDAKGIKAAKKIPKLALKRWYRLWVDVFPDGRVDVYFGDRSAPVLSHQFLAAVPGAVGLHALKAWAKFDDVTVRNEGALP